VCCTETHAFDMHFLLQCTLYIYLFVTCCNTLQHTATQCVYIYIYICIFFLSVLYSAAAHAEIVQVVCAVIRSHTRTHTHAAIYTYVHKHIYTYIYIHMNTYAHIYLYTNICINIFYIYFCVHDSHVRHDSFIAQVEADEVCDVTYSYVWHDSPQVSLDTSICDMPSNVRHDAFTAQAEANDVCGMTRPCV